MLLTLSTTHRPATDLGFLLHKHPDKLQSFTLGFGQAHVVYPEATEERCTAALILDLDPVSLVRGRPDSGARGKDAGGLLTQYVNDRPYVASSFLSVAMGRVFGSAMAGRCEARAELAAMAIPLTATVAPLRITGGEGVVAMLFEPLGYTVELERLGDQTAPCWKLTVSATVCLSDLLSHLYVLIPVLDDDKHYWVGKDEIEKLLRFGEGWLSAHPQRELITRRYLKHGRHLIRDALERLAELDGQSEAQTQAEEEGAAEQQEMVVEKALGLHEQRLVIVLAALKDSGAARVLDLGCGEGKLVRALIKEPQFTDIVAVDVSARELEIARDRLKLDRMAERQRDRLQMFQSALTYNDRRLAGYDAAALVEVVEHIDQERLPAFERAIFGFAHPRTVVLTTPNRDYNAKFPALADGALRHRDHRFEWTRGEFADWTAQVVQQYGYTVALSGIGDSDPEFGQPTQMAVFTCA